MQQGSVWRQQGFVPFWIGETLSQLGAQFAIIAMPIVAVTFLHATEAQMGYLNAAETAAFLLVGLPAGAWLDRVRKRDVMIAADVVRALAVAAVPLLWLTGSLEIWHLYIIGGVVGFATVFFDVGYQSFVPVLVADEHVGSANGALEASAQTMRLGGPAAAGALLAIISAPLLLVANAIGFVASAVALAFVRDHEVVRPKHERQRLVTEIAEGLRFVASTDLLRRLVAVVALSNLSSTFVFTLMPILILRILAMPEWIYGLLMSTSAVGGIIGALVARPLATRFGEGQVLAVSSAVFAPTMALAPLAGVLPAIALPLLLVQGLLLGLSILVFNVVQVTARQRLCPRPLLGRMNASIRFVIWGVMPIAALLSGWLGATFGTETTLWIGVVVGGGSALPLLLSGYRSMRQLPTRPTEPTATEQGVGSA